VKDDFSIHVLKDVAICSNTFWIPRFAQNDDAPAVFLLWGVVDHSTTPTHGAIKNPRPAESAAVCGRKLQSKGLAKFFGYFLPKKVTTRTNIELC